MLILPFRIFEALKKGDLLGRPLYASLHSPQLRRRHSTLPSPCKATRPFQFMDTYGLLGVELVDILSTVHHILHCTPIFGHCEGIVADCEICGRTRNPFLQLLQKVGSEHWFVRRHCFRHGHRTTTCGDGPFKTRTTGVKSPTAPTRSGAPRKGHRHKTKNYPTHRTPLVF